MGCSFTQGKCHFPSLLGSDELAVSTRPDLDLHCQGDDNPGCLTTRVSIQDVLRSNRNYSPSFPTVITPFHLSAQRWPVSLAGQVGDHTGVCLPRQWVSNPADQGNPGAKLLRCPHLSFF